MPDDNIVEITRRIEKLENEGDSGQQPIDIVMKSVETIRLDDNTIQHIEDPAIFPEDFELSHENYRSDGVLHSRVWVKKGVPKTINAGASQNVVGKTFPESEPDVPQSSDSGTPPEAQ
jgi:hypothetical protein